MKYIILIIVMITCTSCASIFMFPPEATFHSQTFIEYEFPSGHSFSLPEDIHPNIEGGLWVPINSYFGGVGTSRIYFSTLYFEKITQEPGFYIENEVQSHIWNDWFNKGGMAEKNPIPYDTFKLSEISIRKGHPVKFDFLVHRFRYFFLIIGGEHYVIKLHTISPTKVEYIDHAEETFSTLLKKNSWPVH